MPVVILWVLFLPPGLRPWPPPDPVTAALVRESQDGNQAGIAVVRSLTCRIDQSWLGRVPNGPDDPVPDLNAWDFWMDDDTVRVRDRVVPGWYSPRDTVQRGGREMELVRRRDGNPSYVVISRKRRLANGDARKVCLFSCWELDAPQQENLSLASVLDRPHEVWAARRVVEDGRNSVYLDLAFPANRLRLWLDPSQNYLIRRAIETSGGQTQEYRATEFQRSPDGATVPVRIEHRISLPKAHPATLLTVLADVRLNEPVPAESFRIPGLGGLRCTDHIQGAEYRLDENGNSAGPWRTDLADDGEDDEPKPHVRRVAQYMLIGLAAAGLLLTAVNYGRRKRADRRTAGL